MSGKGGFTLVELLVAIIIISLLGTIAMPLYQRVNDEAKQAACLSALQNLREGISGWQLKTVAQGGQATWPDIATLTTPGEVMYGPIPPNPFQAPDQAPDSIVLGETKGVIYGDRGGWAYDPSTGQIWANTGTVIPGSGCSGETTVGENEW